MPKKSLFQSFRYSTDLFGYIDCFHKTILLKPQTLIIVVIRVRNLLICINILRENMLSIYGR